MKSILKKYVVLTYLLFYLFILLIGATLFIFNSPIPGEVLKIISAWTSTFVFLAMFKKIYKQENLIEFIKKQFSQKIKLKVLISLFLLQIFIFLIGILIVSFITKAPLNKSITTSGMTIIIMFFSNLIRGPLGEELGWRGFFLNELQRKLNPLKSAIIVGVLWGFWHLPLWLLSGYEGIQLIQYIFFFLVGIISTSVIITAFYNLNHNLVIPIIIHQLFNFLMWLQSGEALIILSITSSVYFLAAAFIVLLNYKNCLYRSKKDMDIVKAM